MRNIPYIYISGLRDQVFLSSENEYKQRQHTQVSKVGNLWHLLLVKLFKYFKKNFEVKNTCDRQLIVNVAVNMISQNTKAYPQIEISTCEF